MITLTSKNALSNLPPQNSLAAMSSLELSSVAVLRVVKVSPERGCRRGSTLTSWQTSVRRCAIRSRTSLCRHMVTPPEGHDRACSVEKVVPHTHSLGRSGGVQLYLRHSASRKAPLWRANPWAAMGNAVSQLWAPFSLPSSAALCRCWGSRAFTSVATSSCLLRLSALRVCLMDCCSCPVSPRSPFCCSISVVSGSVTCSEEVCSSSMAVGFTNPRPPWRDGSARSSRSTSDGLFLPVRAGRNCWRMVSSRGCISGDCYFSCGIIIIYYYYYVEME